MTELADSQPRGFDLASWAMTAAIFAVSVAVFVALPQRTLHGMDADYFIVWVEEGSRQYPRHVAYLFFCGWLYELLESSGFSAFRALLLGSALAAGFGIACTFRGMRWLAGGRTDLAPRVGKTAKRCC